MTLPENIENAPEDIPQQGYVEIVEVESKEIKDDKTQLKEDLVIGAYQCANFLHSNPEDVKLCLLPDAGLTEDVTLCIEHTLIEAYCYENDILVVKGHAAVCMLEKQYLPEINAKEDIEIDLSCVLVLFSKEVEKGQQPDIDKPCFNDDVFHDVSSGPCIKFPV